MADNNNNEGNRTIYLCGEIDEGKCENIAKDILRITEEDDIKDKEQKKYKRNPIHLYIQSCGGNCFEGFALYDLIINSKTPVYTYVTGWAASMAFVLFVAGKKRYISKHATLMIHQPSHFMYGKYKDIKENQDMIDWIYNTVMNIVQERTSISKKEIDDMTDKKRDIYYHQEEAIKKKIATEVYEKRGNGKE